jgi:hypothetical protein
MNKNVKIILGIGIGAGLIYLGYRFLYKKEGQKSVGTAPLSEEIVYDKNTRRVVEVVNE